MLSRAAAAPTHHHHPSLIVRGLNSGLAADVIQQGTADASVSAGIAAAAGLRSGAGRLTTKMARAPPHPYHRLVHGRGVHSRTSPDPIPSTLPKVLDMASKAAAGVAFIAVLGSAIYLHFWVNPELVELNSMFEDLNHHHHAAGHGNTTDKGTGVINKLGKEAAVETIMHSHENRIKALEASRIMDSKAENAELKIALDSAPSQGKV